MRKKIALFFIIYILFYLCSCTLLQKPIDRRTGFSDLLIQTEYSIRNEDWTQAKANLKNSAHVWKKIKPWFQIDIDHDYVKDIENSIALLNGYLDAEDKSESLATIFYIIDIWENINSF